MLPVTTASAEWSFSMLRRLKTWLPSSMCDKRLTSLALLLTSTDTEVKTAHNYGNSQNAVTEQVIFRISVTILLHYFHSLSFNVCPCKICLSLSGE